LEKEFKLLIKVVEEAKINDDNDDEKSEGDENMTPQKSDSNIKNYK
jgi:hypothetical protein